MENKTEQYNKKLVRVDFSQKYYGHILIEIDILPVEIDSSARYLKVHPD